jgi:hypothetical protein
MGSVILDPRISLYVDPSTKNYVPSNYRRLKISCILQLKDKYSYVFNSKNILKLKLDNASWWWGGSGTNLQLTAGSNDKVIYKTEVKLYPEAKKILLYIEILYNHSVPLQSIGQTVGILPIKIPSKLMIISKTK